MVRPKDVSKLFWNVHHRFRCDPCCRFVCGLTIENTTARFWHFSRSAVMVSEPFDIIKVGTLQPFSTWPMAHARNRMRINSSIFSCLRPVPQIRLVWALTLQLGALQLTRRPSDDIESKSTIIGTKNKSRSSKDSRIRLPHRVPLPTIELWVFGPVGRGSSRAPRVRNLMVLPLLSKTSGSIRIEKWKVPSLRKCANLSKTRQRIFNCSWTHFAMAVFP
jgi:Fungal protein kinase